MDSAKTARTTLAELLAPARSNPSHAAILCDVDGTLAPIVSDPASAGVPEPTRVLLRRVADAYGLVGCVSGRQAVAAREIVGVEDIVYAGNHGLEVLRPGAAEPELAGGLEGRARAAAELVASLDARALAAAGIRVEDKGPIVALHWRGAAGSELARERAGEVAEQAERVGLHPHFGRMVLELRPLDDVNKGSAVVALLAGHPDLRWAMFGGDDATDLDAFAGLRCLAAEDHLDSAVCIGVASSEAPPGLVEAADALVDGTDGFRAVLEALLEERA